MSMVLVNASFAACPPFPALLHDSRVLALRHWADRLAFDPNSFEALLAHWSWLAEALRALCQDPTTAATIARQGVSADAVRLHAPVAPRQVYCTIGNYRDQVLEAALDADDGPQGPGAPARRASALAAIEQRGREGSPYVCLKGSLTVADPAAPLLLTPELNTLDWEVELGVVIGRRAWQVDPHQALDHVAGYCVVNDLTLRDRIFRHDVKGLGTDWIQSKARPGWLPAGPWFSPVWNVPDPQRLRLQLHLNGQPMQSGWSGDMLFGVAEQIAYLSWHVRLEPGDLICTGSPAGFGSHHRRFLRPGDLIEASIDGLGRQHTRCVPA
ncbi:MAG TPA: fumarylacetoacetate hydrolase family protein [Methylibium sp.]|nr:fumarylacetoacetate hydrolase family protein [Methylibium sp.]